MNSPCGVVAVGYEQRGAARIALYSGGNPHSRWVDLDALLAAWALSEGEEVFTERAAETWHRAGARGLEALWAEPIPPVDPWRSGAELIGPATVFPLLASTPCSATSPTKPPPPIARATYTTREILFPDLDTPSSKLAEKVRQGALDGAGVTGAWRLGCVLLQCDPRIPAARGGPADPVGPGSALSRTRHARGSPIYSRARSL